MGLEETFKQLQEDAKDKYYEQLHRFRLPLWIAIGIFSINIVYTIYLNLTDPIPDLLKKQLELETEQLQELRESKEVLFRIEEVYLQAVEERIVPDTLNNK